MTSVSQAADSPITLADCPACGSGNPAVAASLDEPGRRERFHAFDERKYGGLMAGWLDQLLPVILQCRACGHSWYGTQPAYRQLSLLYEQSRPLLDVELPREPSAAMLTEMRRLRRMTQDQGSPPTLLDYGSGFGRWARAAVAAGFAVTAFEPSAIRGDRGDTGFVVVHDLARVQGTFDAIQLEQVLEHVSQPLDTLRQLRRFCHQDTVLRVTVPNILRAPEGRALWDTWPFDGRAPHTLAPFEHLHGFTPMSLRAVCARAGFRAQPAWRTWRHDTVRQFRRMAGAVISRLDTTSLFLRRAPE